MSHQTKLPVDSVECSTPHDLLIRCSLSNLQFPAYCTHLVWLNLSSPSINRTLLHELGGSRFGVSSMERPCRPPDMSNFCCLPGRAGGTPVGVYLRNRPRRRALNCRKSYETNRSDQDQSSHYA